MNDFSEIRDFKLDLKSINASLLNVPWEQSNDYFALASVGAIVKGWSLVFPRKRAFSFSSMLSDPALTSFVKRIRTIVAAEYGNCWVFEHGSAACGSATGCGVDYAHLHLVPLSFSLCDASRAYDPLLKWDTMQLCNVENFVAGREYLLCSTSDQAVELTTVQVALPATPTSQFFRRVVASAVGCPNEFDYRKNLQVEACLAGRAELLRAAAEYPRLSQ